MPVVGRQLPKEIQEIFDRYKSGAARRLTKEEAIEMLEKEFHLTNSQAEKIFITFDVNKDGIMSLLEFKQFYAAVGDSVHDIVAKFEAMDTDKSGKLDAEEAMVGLKTLKGANDHEFTEKELEFFIRTNQGKDGLIDLGEFIKMLRGLMMYKPS